MASRLRLRIVCCVDMAQAMGRGCLHGVAEVAHERGWELLVSAWNWNRGFPDLRALGADACVVQPPGDPGWAAWLRAAGLPAVVLGSPAQGFPSVTVDEREVGVQAARCFRRHGFARMAYVGMDWMPWGAEQLAGARTELPVDHFPGLRACSDDHALIERLAAWLAALPPPVALAANGSRLAHLALAAAARAGRRVPEDLAVLCLDDEEGLAEICRPALAMLETPRPRIGRAAALLLERLRDGEAAPGEPLLIAPSGIVMRASADRYAVDDEIVHDCMRILRSPEGGRLAIRDLALRLRVGQRTLERRFAAAMGSGIHQEVLRLRLERARVLLGAGDNGLRAVARLSGFRSESAFARAFRRAHGMTPGRWRDGQRGA